ncbi:MAG: hypothetical protein ACOC92_00275 [bacterium]
MTRGAPHRSRRVASWLDLLPLAALLAPAVAVLLRSLPMGLACAALQGPLDARFVGYVLEWGYLHLQGAAAPDGSLWSPPFFYPVRDLLAYSDNFISGYLFYFPLRWLGLGPSSALFAFHLLQRALTPIVAYFCLRSLRLGRWPSFVAAALFSWGWVRYFHYGHIQFAAGYPIPLFFTALYFAYHRCRPWALVLAAGTFLFVWYLSLYTAVFLVLGTVALAVAHLLLPGGAHEAAAVLRFYRRFAGSRPRQALAVVLLCAVAAGLLVPSATVYLGVQQEFGPASKAEVRAYWGDVLAWVRPPPHHLILGSLHDLLRPPTKGLWEKRPFLGWLGFLGLILPAGGVLIRGRRVHSLWPRPLVAVSGAGAALILVFSSYGGRWPEIPFWLLHDHFPGLGGLRAPTRIAFVVSWFAVLCMATHLQRLAPARRSLLMPVVAGCLGLALLAESLAPLPRIADRCPDEAVWAETERHLCPTIPRDEVGTVLFLPASLYSVQRIAQHTLAMHLSLACDLNVVNGYSGRRPKLMAPLLGTRPQKFPCPTVREILDRVHEDSGKGILIHLDREPPLGLADYPRADLRSCLAPCLAPEPAWYAPQPGRPAEVFVTDPGASCEGPGRG